jgi:hypothetical protein
LGGNSDVSRFSPDFSPRVFDDPSFRGVSNKGNSVVKRLFTVREDSFRVELEVIGINSDGNWLLGNGDGELVNISLGNIMVRWDFEISSLDFASSRDWVVWVFVFSGDSVFFNIFESVVHKSSIASLVSVGWWAVNQLRFRERLEFFGSEKGRGSFKRSNSGESPAWSALSLVFDGSNGNGRSSSPVNGVRDGGIDGFDIFFSVRLSKSQKHVFEFSGSQVSEFIGFHGVSSVRFLHVRADFFDIGGVNRESVVVFSSSSVNFSVLDFPVIERIIHGSGDFLFGLLVLENKVSSSQNGSDGK